MREKFYLNKITRKSVKAGIEFILKPFWTVNIFDIDFEFSQTEKR